MDQLQGMDKSKGLLASFVLQGFFGICFLISSFVVANTANMGFNVVFTALLTMAYIGGAVYVVRKSRTPLAWGFLIGVSAMITLLSLMTAIYWGQLAGCEDTSKSIDQYSCSNKSGYRAVAAFESLLFILQLPTTVLLVHWRDEFLNEPSMYDDISGPGAGGAGDGSGSFSGASAAAGGAYDSSYAGAPAYDQAGAGGSETRGGSYAQPASADL